jgi:integrase
MPANIRLAYSSADAIPAIVNGTVHKPPKRIPNAELRTREYLTPSEMKTLIAEAGKNRWGHRDATMVLMAYRHGLRAKELVEFRWSQVDFDGASMHVCRAKSGVPSVHPLNGDELRALRRLKRESGNAEFVFVSERGAPFSTAGFRKMIARLGKDAGFEFGVHPHMLRHACGFKLANDGKDTRSLQVYMGHKNLMHTARYTEMAPNRFRDWWRD